MRLAGGDGVPWTIPVSVNMDSRGRGEAREAWYSGRLVIENGDVMLQVAAWTEIPAPPAPGKSVAAAEGHGADGDQAGAAPDGRSLRIRGLYWVCARQVLEPPRFAVRSEVWQLPEGPDRDFFLRQVSARLATCLRNWGGRVELGRGERGMVELAFMIPVPLNESVDYMSLWLPIRQRCRCPSILWSPPEVLSSRTPSPEDWSRIAYQASQLPSWFRGFCFWSVLLWQEGALWHRLQFSLQERFLPAVGPRFGLPVRSRASGVN